jgi:pimeloyl-[acyl-carrier protein] methyl ester esterase
VTWARSSVGDGPPLILIHGWGMEGRIFRPWLAHLVEHFTCICLDLPGHGASPCAAGLHWDRSLDDLAEILAAWPRPHLLGWSLGGLLALGLALRQPLALASLHLVATSPCFVQRPDWSCALPEAILAEFATRLRSDAHATRQRFVALQVLGDPGARVRLPDTRQWPAPDHGCLEDGLNLLATQDLRPSLRPLDYPVTILQGGRDRIVPPAAGAHLSAALGAEYRLLAEAGHAPFLSDPATCGRCLLEALT